MISLCKSEGIYLFLVNMPTSQENMEILGQKAYQDYISAVRGRIKSTGYAFIDMNTLEKFSCSCFLRFNAS